MYLNPQIRQRIQGTSAEEGLLTDKKKSWFQNDFPWPGLDADSLWWKKQQLHCQVKFPDLKRRYYRSKFLLIFRPESESEATAKISLKNWTNSPKSSFSQPAAPHTQMWF
jgi:hypothetical protein